jgi:hypothetical protein
MDQWRAGGNPLVSAHLHIEGGGNSKEEKIRCREAFASLLKSQGFGGRMPRLTACGGRGTAFDDFKTAHASAKPDHFVGMLIDSEDPLSMPTDPRQQQTWVHLRQRDDWVQPNGATDDQVLFMTTCMETWIAADRETLRAHYGKDLNENQLPPTTQLESRHRHTVENALKNATSACSNAYRKGKRSYEVLGKLKPAVLAALLPSFARAMAILEQKL